MSWVSPDQNTDLPIDNSKSSHVQLPAIPTTTSTQMSSAGAPVTDGTQPGVADNRSAVVVEDIESFTGPSSSSTSARSSLRNSADGEAVAPEISGDSGTEADPSQADGALTKSSSRKSTPPGARQSRWQTAMPKIQEEIALLQSEDEDYRYLYVTNYPGLLFNPSGRFKQIWDSLMALILCFTAVIVPFRVGFSYVSFGPLYWIELLVDIYFTVDIFLNFVTQYENVNDHNRLVMNIRAISHQYLTGWFVPDVMGCLPIDLLNRLAGDEFVCSLSLNGCDKDEGNGSSSGQLFKMFKLLRLFRLMKLLRLFKISRLLSRYQDDLFELMPLIELLKLLGVLFFLGHIMGCFFFYVSVNNNTRMDFEDEFVTWVDGLRDKPVISQYIASMYWAFTTMTTVGYGDISAITVSERIVAIVSMIMGGFIFSSIISGMASAMESGKLAEQESNHKLEQVSLMVRQNYLTKSLRNRILNHIRIQEYPSYDICEIAAILPAGMRRQLMEVVYSSTLHAGIFKKCSMDFIHFILQNASFRHYDGGEVLELARTPAEGIYVIKTGRIKEMEPHDVQINKDTPSEKDKDNKEPEPERAVLAMYGPGDTVLSELLMRLSAVSLDFPGMVSRDVECISLCTVVFISAGLLERACKMYHSDFNQMEANAGLQKMEASSRPGSRAGSRLGTPNSPRGSLQLGGLSGIMKPSTPSKTHVVAGNKVHPTPQEDDPHAVSHIDRMFNKRGFEAFPGGAAGSKSTGPVAATEQKQSTAPPLSAKSSRSQSPDGIPALALSKSPLRTEGGSARGPGEDGLRASVSQVKLKDPNADDAGAGGPGGAASKDGGRAGGAEAMAAQLRERDQLVGKLQEELRRMHAEQCRTQLLLAQLTDELLERPTPEPSSNSVSSLVGE